MTRLVECAQRHRLSYPVGSSSSNKSYEVKAFLPNELPSCKCIGFATKRNKLANAIGGGYAGAGAGLARSTAASCKHLDAIIRETCTWQQKPGEQMQFTCPDCLGPVVYVDAPRLPAGRFRVDPNEVPATSAPSMTNAPKKAAPVTKAVKAAAAKKAARKLPKPDALIKMAQELAAKNDADPKPEKKAPKTFEDIVGRKAPAKKTAAPADTAAPKDSATDAAAALAAMLEKA